MSDRIRNGRPSTRATPRLRYQTLFSLLVLLYVAPGSMFGGTLGRVVTSATTTLVVAGVLYASGAHRRQRLVGAVLGAPYVLLHVVHAARPDVVRDETLAVMSLVFVGFVLVTVIRDLLARDEVYGDAIFAAACAYLLLGVFWGAGYLLIDAAVPGSFRFPDGAGTMSFDRAMYFSLVTLTTLGYGDISPASPLAQRVATLEAVTGVLYVAVVISRLIAAVRRPDQS